MRFKIILYIGDMMRDRDGFQAYLDDYDKIHVSVSNESKCFYLRDSDEKISELKIVRKFRDYETVCYELTFDNELRIGEEYEILTDVGRSTILKYRYIVKQDRFDDEFYCDQTLGMIYQKHQTLFQLWAPTAYRVKLEISINQQITTYEMNRCKGVFQYVVIGDLEYASYVYLVRVNGEWIEVVDPYAYASTGNGKRSVVVDLKRIHMKQYALPKLNSDCDAILYEVSIKDYTSQKGIGVKHPGKFLGFVEENEETRVKHTGFTYLKSLGITHVQFMPVMDFGSVDEYHPSLFYNWGYDPVQFFTLEGSYGTDSCDPYSRILEFQTLVETCHKNKIRVNLDLVMNHVYDINTNALRVVPYYYVLMNEKGERSNGSFCGNDFDSCRKMGRKMILDVCQYLIKTFDIDGIRFDLMGIFDIETMNQVSRLCHSLKPDFMVYGEGWNMPSMLAYEKRACIQHEKQLVQIAHFSDRFRDVVKAYCSGNTDLIEVMKNVMVASTIAYGSNELFSSPTNAIHYVECHDNRTSWDTLCIDLKETSEEVKIKCHIMLLVVTILSQGIPFLHSGQEYARTKQGKANTYCDGDKVNQIDYDRRNHYEYLVFITKALISIRKTYALFRLSSVEEIKQFVSFEEIDHQVLIYQLKDHHDEIKVILNPTAHVFHYTLDGCYQLLFYYQAIEQESKNKELVIDAYASIVLVKKVSD